MCVCLSVPVSVYAYVHSYKKDDATAKQGTAMRVEVVASGRWQARREEITFKNEQIIYISVIVFTKDQAG